MFDSALAAVGLSFVLRQLFHAGGRFSERRKREEDDEEKNEVKNNTSTKMIAVKPKRKYCI